jgi:prefoldin subunit 5
MKTTLIKAIVVLVAITSITAITYALDPNTAPPKITFEKAEPVQWDYTPGTSQGDVRIPRDFPKPTHAVTIEIESYYLQKTRHMRSGLLPAPRTSTFIEGLLNADMSSKLQLLIQNGYLGAALPNRSFTYRLFAYSEDEAKALTRTIVDACTEAASERVKESTLHRANLIEQIPRRKEAITSRTQEIKDVKAEIDKLGQSAYFTSLDEANQTVVKMNEQLNQLNIEVAGLRAKQGEISAWRRQIKETIKPLQESGNYGPWGNIMAHVEQSHIDLMIELRSAEARKLSMESIRNKAWRYSQLNTKSLELPKALGKSQKFLAQEERSLKVTEKALTTPDSAMKPPVIRGTVKIHEILGMPGR